MVDLIIYDIVNLQFTKLCRLPCCQGDYRVIVRTDIYLDHMPRVIHLRQFPVLITKYNIELVRSALKARAQVFGGSLLGAPDP